MSDVTHNPWEAPDDAPVSEPRTSWGADRSAAPVERAGEAAEPAAAPYPETPAVPVPGPGQGAEPWAAPAADWDPADLAAFHAGAPLPDPGTTSDATSETTTNFDPFQTAVPDAGPAAPAGDVEEHRGASSDWPEPVDPAGTATQWAADPTSPQELPDLFAAADSDDWNLPDLFGDPHAEPLTTEVPTAAPSAALVPASETTAMTSWHAMRAARDEQAQQAAPVAPTEDRELAHRYASADRLTGIVDQVLNIAQSGNTRVQALINSFELTRDHTRDREQRAAYEAAMVQAMTDKLITVDNPLDFKTVLDLAYDEIIGVGPLGPLWRDDSVTEILVSGPNSVECERDGVLVPTPVKFRSLEHLRKTARDLAARVDDRSVSRSNPLVTAQLPGARVQFALAPVAPVAGVSITIRKFRPLFGLDDLLRFGALTNEMAAFLSDTVAARATILVSGGTGSGKTTMINALSAFIPDTERVITIEDALELSLSNAHVESLLTKELASGDDKVIIGQDELLRATLRMRPDRIIVGEIRDGSGCATMLQAANTGHDGTMTTVHANNPDRALRRLSQLLRTTSDNMGDDLAAEEVRMAFDLVVQVVRVRGRRFVSAISLVNKDTAGTTPIFTGTYAFGQAAPEFRRVGSLGSDTDMAQRFLDAGLDPTPWG